jgi:hypothetical protein
MRIFVSYKFTGEDPLHVESVLTHSCSALTDHEVVCTFFQQDVRALTPDKAYEHCLRILDEPFDAVLAIIHSNEQSKGMQLELEKAKKRNIPLLLAIQKNLAHEQLRNDAHKVLEFSHLTDLQEKLRLI